MEEGILEEMTMTGDLGKMDDMKKEEKGTTVTGEVVEMRDKTETGKKETGEDTRIEEIETERVRPEEEAVPGSLEEEDLAPKDQEEANPEDREKVP